VGAEQGLEEERGEGDGGGGLDRHGRLAADAAAEHDQQEARRPHPLREHVVAGEVTARQTAAVQRKDKRRRQKQQARAGPKRLVSCLSGGAFVPHRHQARTRG